MSDLWVAEVLDHEALAQRDAGLPHFEPAPTAARVPGTRSMLEALDPIDVSLFFDPVRWLRWRREVHRRGPYAPAYDGRFVQVDGVAQRLGFVAVLILIVTVVVALAL